MILNEKLINYKVVVLTDIYNFSFDRFFTKVIWKFWILKF
jgi:hypothetical protein